MRGENIYPIYVEISLAGSCNHRCIFCAYDFVGYKPNFLDSVVLKNRLSEMGRLGVKSILYSGEGEPLLHKDICDIIRQTKESGIDVALASNGVFFSKEIANSILPLATWIKISINAGKKETYAKIHKTHLHDFDKVIKNISSAVRLKREKSYKCTLGMQLLLLPENKDEVFGLAKIAKAIGADYLVIKPYSQHPLSKTTIYKNIKYSEYGNLADNLSRLNDKYFNVVFRINTMQKWDRLIRGYGRCYALPFWAHMDSSGQVWGCQAYLGDERFLYGNIYKNTFKQIWAGAKRKQCLALCEKKININKCRLNCRMGEINRYLWNLKNLPEHVNFI